MTSKEMAKLALAGIEDKKGEDIKVLDIADVSVMADYFLIASGSNRNQVQAMADSVEEKLQKAGVSPRHIEGYQTANWILMDFNDVIVHIFNEEDRLFYNLEKIWLDGTVIDTDRLR
ncbi:MAG: ribosome silencing factor [Clostridium sp.]|nr:ribosome silencing factor [Clostridium sp.]